MFVSVFTYYSRLYSDPHNCTKVARTNAIYKTLQLCKQVARLQMFGMRLSPTVSVISQ